MKDKFMIKTNPFRFMNAAGRMTVPSPQPPPRIVLPLLDPVSIPSQMSAGEFDLLVNTLSLWREKMIGSAPQDYEI